MKILLDTHIWLWMQVEPEKIAGATRELLADGSNLLYLSAASSWEIAIKWSLGKLLLPEPPGQYVPKAMIRQESRRSTSSIATRLRWPSCPLTMGTRSTGC